MDHNNLLNNGYEIYCYGLLEDWITVNRLIKYFMNYALR